MSEKFGKIAQVIGPVVDVAFEGEGNTIPPIYTALKIDRPDGSMLVLEVEQHIGENTVRCVAMDSTDGLQRGMRVDNLDRPIAVPTGDQVKGMLRGTLVEDTSIVALNVTTSDPEVSYAVATSYLNNYAQTTDKAHSNTRAIVIDEPLNIPL